LKIAQIAVVSIVVIGLIGGLGLFAIGAIQRSNAIDDAKIAAAFCASSLSKTEAESAVIRLHDEQGMAWADAATTFRRMIGCKFRS
jgi:hypothetical protein